MSERVTVSVIMTARDAERHIANALASLLAQTRPPDQIVVIDDGSRDSTLQAAEQALAGCSRAVVVAASPRGRAAALKAAVARADGRWIANLDADDWLAPQWLETVLAIGENDARLGAVGAATQRMLGAAEPESLNWPPPTEAVQDVTSRVARHNPLGHSGVLMRREALIAVGDYDAARKRQLDYDLWIRLAEAGWRLGRVQSPLIAKRVHDGQSFERTGRWAYLRSSFALQLKAIRITRGGPSAYGLAGARFAWGLLPRPLRLMLRA